ncbi:acyl-CoA dehydrogenase family protein [Nonomuraea rubra]|uniref:acyl-CoA dehydrogenase family protein n=1 Tax=Nonomuraea rubra TaxID=46180 RepID=UPI003CD06425
MNDLLLPIVKGVGSERSYELLSRSLQTLGGSGYLQEYPIEQYIRDAKIDSLYEGTTAIQGQDLFFRKILRQPGRRGRRAAGRDQRVRRVRGGQRAAQGGAQAAPPRPRPRSRPWATPWRAGRSARWRPPRRSTRSG